MPKKLVFDQNKFNMNNQEEEKEVTFSKNQIVKIPIEKIELGENIRDINIDAELEDLAATIKEYGLIHPISVYEENGKYIIKTGSRRYKACVLCDIPEIDCIISDKFDNEIDRIVIQAIENEHREDMSPREREKYVKRLKDLGLSQREIAKKLNKNETWISKQLTAINFVEENSDILNGLDEEITTRQAYELSKLSKTELDKVVTKAKEKGNTKKTVKEELEKRNIKNTETKEPEEEKTIEQENIELNDIFVDIEFDDEPTDKANDINNGTEEVNNIDLKFSITENKSSKKIKISNVSKENQELISFVKRQIENFYIEKGYNID